MHCFYNRTNKTDIFLYKFSIIHIKRKVIEVEFYGTLPKKYGGREYESYGTGWKISRVL